MIRLKDRVAGEVQPVRIKIDPGSKVTSVAVVRQEEGKPAKVLCLIELMHRSRQISKRLTVRRGYRHRRRSTNCRYREPRFDNRLRQKGWLPPSLQHRVDTCMAWVERLQRLAPVAGNAVERVRSNTQLMQNAEISGVEYQHGTLAGCEVREYVLEKHGRKCSYCSVTGVPLNLDHVEARARGGSNRPSSIVPACIPCNKAKGAMPIEEFLAGKPKRLAAIKANLKAPLKDAAAVNATKFNRHRRGIPKTHALDTARVGEVEALVGWQVPTLTVTATGRRTYCRTRVNKYGFRRGDCMREKAPLGIKTGDIVRAEVPKGKHTGIHVGRVAIRESGSFAIGTAAGKVDGINWRHCRILQRADGYGYAVSASPGRDCVPIAFLPTAEAGGTSRRS